MEVVKNYYEKIFLLGDIHGHFHSILDKSMSIKKSLIVQVGDFGMGFIPEDMFGVLNRHLFRNETDLIYILGNHDNPRYRLNKDENSKFNKKYSNIKILMDYTSLTINDKKFLFVGGAISIDRGVRTLGRDYWVDEAVVRPQSHQMIELCDVLVTHTAPRYYTDLGILGPKSVDDFIHSIPALKLDINNEGIIINEILDKCMPKAHYFGHFHNDRYGKYSSEDYLYETHWRCVNIDELLLLD